MIAFLTKRRDLAFAGVDIPVPDSAVHGITSPRLARDRLGTVLMISQSTWILYYHRPYMFSICNCQIILAFELVPSCCVRRSCPNKTECNTGWIILAIIRCRRGVHQLEADNHADILFGAEKKRLAVDLRHVSTGFGRRENWV